MRCLCLYLSATLIALLRQYHDACMFLAIAITTTSPIRYDADKDNAEIIR